jgi:hypothetical protein
MVHSDGGCVGIIFICMPLPTTDRRSLLTISLLSYPHCITSSSATQLAKKKQALDMQSMQSQMQLALDAEHEQKEREKEAQALLLMIIKAHRLARS